MPYKVERSGSCPANRPFGVFKEGSTKSLGCHPTVEAARKQLRALYAQESVTDPTALTLGTFKAREVLSAAEAKFTDVPDGRIQAEVTIIRPGESLNRRFYSAESIQRAIDSGFWENSPMYADHPDDMRLPQKRRITSLVAGLTNVHRGPSGEAIGTATFFNRDFGKFAMEAKDHVGVSAVHYFKGQRYRGTDGHYHERVDDFLVNHSVDFVASPAAGGGIMNFLPAQESEDNVAFEEITPEMIQQIATARPDLVEVMRTASEAKESDPPDPTPDPLPDPLPDPKPDEGKAKGKMVSMAEVQKMVAESVQTALSARDQSVKERATVEAKAKVLISKSGLPEPVRNRIQSDLAASATAENIETLAAEAITAAAAEGKAWAPPRVSGMGPSAATPAAAGEAKPLSMSDAAKQSPAIGAFFGTSFGGGQAAPSGKES